DYFLVLFFSGRRRHTRFSRDWTSDVCSSDLSVYPDRTRLVRFPSPTWLQLHTIFPITGSFVGPFRNICKRFSLSSVLFIIRSLRSEERRVGKVCFSRFLPCSLLSDLYDYWDV